MANQHQSITTFEPERVVEPIHTGGTVAISQDGAVLATCLGEDAVLTDMTSGRRLAKVEGVSVFPLCAMTIQSHKCH